MPGTFNLIAINVYAYSTSYYDFIQQFLTPAEKSQPTVLLLGSIKTAATPIIKPFINPNSVHLGIKCTGNAGHPFGPEGSFDKPAIEILAEENITAVENRFLPSKTRFYLALANFIPKLDKITWMATGKTPNIEIYEERSNFMQSFLNTWNSVLHGNHSPMDQYVIFTPWVNDCAVESNDEKSAIQRCYKTLQILFSALNIQAASNPDIQSLVNELKQKRNPFTSLLSAVIKAREMQANANFSSLDPKAQVLIKKMSAVFTQKSLSDNEVKNMFAKLLHELQTMTSIQDPTSIEMPALVFAESPSSVSSAIFANAQQPTVTTDFKRKREEDNQRSGVNQSVESNDAARKRVKTSQ